MEIKRKISYKKHLLSFFITLTVFIAVFLFSSLVNTSRLEYLERSKRELEKEIYALNILKADFCKKAEESLLMDELNKIKERLSFVRESLGADQKKVIELEESFSLIQLEYLNIIKKSNQKCDFNLIPIIYIYSIEDNNNKSDHKIQKFVFSYLNGKYSNLRFFSFNASLELPEIQRFIPKLEETGKEKFPIIIVKEKRYYEHKNRQEMKEILENFDLVPRMEELQIETGK